ncbi:hypothetical protein Mapa_014070 [Marchantia paleacea]|nr:hypothetical protein Mapa_014070 [Marchantia paleacea]
MPKSVVRLGSLDITGLAPIMACTTATMKMKFHFPLDIFGICILEAFSSINRLDFFGEGTTASQKSTMKVMTVVFFMHLFCKTPVLNKRMSGVANLHPLQ